MRPPLVRTDARVALPRRRRGMPAVGVGRRSRPRATRGQNERHGVARASRRSSSRQTVPENQIQTVESPSKAAPAAAARANVGAMYNDDAGPTTTGRSTTTASRRTSSTRSHHHVPPAGPWTSRRRARHLLLARRAARRRRVLAPSDARRLLHHVRSGGSTRCASSRSSRCGRPRLGAFGIARGPQRRVPPQQVLNVAVSDTMACVSYTFGSPGDGSPLCAVQASMQQLFETASVCWTTVIAGARSKHLSPSSLGARGMTLRPPALSLSLSSLSQARSTSPSSTAATRPRSDFASTYTRGPPPRPPCSRSDSRPARSMTAPPAAGAGSTTVRWSSLLPGDARARARDNPPSPSRARVALSRALTRARAFFRARGRRQRARRQLRWLLFYGPLWLAISFNTAVYLLTVRADPPPAPRAAAPRGCEAEALARAPPPPPSPTLRALRGARRCGRSTGSPRSRATRRRSGCGASSTACGTLPARSHPSRSAWRSGPAALGSRGGR